MNIYITHKSREVLDLQPVCRSFNSALDNSPVTGKVVGLISQDSFLKRNLRAEILNIIEESGDGSVIGDEGEFDENLEVCDRSIENIITITKTSISPTLPQLLYWPIAPAECFQTLMTHKLDLKLHVVKF